MSARHRRLFTASIVALLPAVAAAQTTTLESVATNGAQQNGGAFMPASATTISDDGRWITFTSYATTLVANDSNLNNDVFVRDCVAGTTLCCSLNPSGKTGSNASQNPSISADGRWVVFESTATDLVAGDTNSYADVFLYDTTTAQLSRISVTTGGAQAGGFDAAITADGRYVAFASGASNFDPNDSNNMIDIFVRDLVLGITTIVSTDASGAAVANGHCYKPSISDDGRFVSFRSTATTFAAPDTGKFEDVFLKDLQTGAVVRVSGNTSGGESNGRSHLARVCGDGHLVFYYTEATDVAVGDATIYPDVVVYDVATGVNSLVNVSSTGAQADFGGTDPAPSFDGRYCAFASGAKNLDPLAPNGTARHIFVRDLLQGRCVLESVDDSWAIGNGNSSQPSITRDGKQVVFASFATNLDPADANYSTINDIFLRDRGEVRLVEFGQGLAGKGGFVPRLSGSDGRETLGDFTVHVEDGLGGALALLWIGAQTTDYFPFFGGHFYVSFSSSWLQLPIVLGGAAGVAGAGALDLPGADVSAYDGIPLYLQVTVADPAAPKKVALSNGLEMHIGD